MRPNRNAMNTYQRHNVVPNLLEAKEKSPLGYVSTLANDTFDLQENL